VADDDSEDELPRAWNPFTPAGVASFANSPLSQLLTVQFVGALLVFLSFTFYLDRSWATALDSAVENFPAGSRLQDGRLWVPGGDTVLLSTNRFVGIVYTERDAADSVSDIKIRLSSTGLSIATLPGYIALPYPRSWSIALDRGSLSPRWGAWRSAVVPLTAGAGTLGVVFSWILLAGLYAWPLRLLVFFRDKLTSRLGCWKLCAAALLPGALLMASATVFHTLGQIPIIGLAMAFVTHLLLGWAYVICGAVALPFLPEAERLRDNPFNGDRTAPKGVSGSNPFRRK
jgi:hypothetical protein